MEIKEKNINQKLTKGSIFMSPLFRRFLLPIILTMLGFTCAVYFFAVPYLKNLVYSLEERAVMTNLQNIHKLIEANALATEAYKESVTSAHERQLKNITLFMNTYLKNKVDQVHDGFISIDEAQLTALEELRTFRYGNNDYVWVADYNSYYLSHPDPNMHMEDFSDVRDVFGNYVLAPLVQQAMEKGEGYNSFWWQRLHNDLPAEKLAYAKLFPEWEWVIGTGVYLDDLETKVLLRKEKMIEELRQILKQIVIADTGYMYIFDAWHNIIIHPDPELENQNMSTWDNPSTGNKLAMDLIQSAHAEDNKVQYVWDRPDDKGNFIYEKIEWVTHIDTFDWYVVASVYTNELNNSSILLRNRIFMLAIVVVVFSFLIVTLLMRKLLNPIRRLSGTAGKVKEGDLSAQSDVDGNDEIGFLAKAFNSMVLQLRETIETLDQKVLQRTEDLNRTNKELTTTIGKLERHNEEVTRLNAMAEKLNSCDTLEETYLVIVESLSGLFHGAAGVLYMCLSDEHNSQFLKPVAKWGKHAHFYSDQPLDVCRSLKGGRVLVHDSTEETDSVCTHIHDEPPYVSVCIPLIGMNQVIGLIHIIYAASEQELQKFRNDEVFENLKPLATSASDHIAMALSNTRLREELQYLSVRDDLTGLFNRRYMEETLEREFMQAERNRTPISIIILDVDFFKNFNDNYGHKVGDHVLIQLANMLAGNIRKGDIVCRYGGEEFLIIMPGASGIRAIERAEKLREKVENDLIIKHNGHRLNITISLGTAACPDNGNTHEEVMKAADDALYKAKENGRNMVVLA
jgi:diguanylate cyclase (GGDEF)-like protein